MASFVRAYDRLLAGLAGVGGVALALLAIFIAYEVTLRTVGIRPPVWPVAVAEYTLLYATTLAAPYLLHRSEHVIVTSFIVILRPSTRAKLERVVCAIGMIVCLVVAGFALRVTLTAQGLEIRSFEMPRWMLYAPLPLGFFLMAIEFGRHMLHGGLFAGEEIEYMSRKAP